MNKQCLPDFLAETCLPGALGSWLLALGSIPSSLDCTYRTLRFLNCLELSADSDWGDDPERFFGHMTIKVDPGQDDMPPGKTGNNDEDDDDNDDDSFSGVSGLSEDDEVPFGPSRLAAGEGQPSKSLEILRKISYHGGAALTGVTHPDCACVHLIHDMMPHVSSAAPLIQGVTESTCACFSLLIYTMLRVMHSCSGFWISTLACSHSGACAIVLAAAVGCHPASSACMSERNVSGLSSPLTLSYFFAAPNSCCKHVVIATLSLV